MTTYNRTKIIATVGPASSSEKILEEMIKDGVDIFRINFSHGSYDDLRKVIFSVRKLNKKLDSNIGILADLQGPKIRIGKIKDNSIQLKEGKEILFTSHDGLGDETRLHVPYVHFAKDVAIGDSVLINDGKFLLKVVETNKKDTVKAKIIAGGELTSNKGVNLQNTKISLTCLTEKDLKDWDFAVEKDVE